MPGVHTIEKQHGVGVHQTEIDAFIEGEVLLNDNTSDFRRSSVNAEYPLPNFGGWYMYSWSPKWLVHARVDWLSVSIGDYSGGLLDSMIGVNYQAFKNIGIGLGYNNFILDVDVDNSGWNGAVDNRHHGPQLSLTATW